MNTISSSFNKFTNLVVDFGEIIVGFDVVEFDVEIAFYFFVSFKSGIGCLISACFFLTLDEVV